MYKLLRNDLHVVEFKVEPSETKNFGFSQFRWLLRLAMKNIAASLYLLQHLQTVDQVQIYQISYRLADTLVRLQKFDIAEMKYIERREKRFIGR